MHSVGRLERHVSRAEWRQTLPVCILPLEGALPEPGGMASVMRTAGILCSLKPQILHAVGSLSGGIIPPVAIPLKILNETCSKYRIAGKFGKLLVTVVKTKFGEKIILRFHTASFVYAWTKTALKKLASV